METSSLDFETGMSAAKTFHEDLYAEIILGTRMAIVGLNAIGIGDPKGADQESFIVYVETDRCASDAMIAITGCHPGKRTMKILDYGKMAATFVNLKTGRAIRVVARNREFNTVLTREEIKTSSHAGAYAVMPLENLFEIKEVRVELEPEDMPGNPLRIVTCQSCGEPVMDMREVRTNGKVLCRPCAQGTCYYTVVGSSGRPRRAGNIVRIDPRKCEVTVEGNRVELTTTEFRILQLLASRDGWVFSRDMILTHLWGSDKMVLERSIDVHIRNLRRKMGEAGAMIKNMRGVGYKLEWRPGEIPLR